MVWLCNNVQTMPVVILHRTVQLVKRMHVPQMPLQRTIHKLEIQSGIVDLGTSVSRLSRQQSTAPASALLLLLLQKVNDIVRSKLIAEL